MMETLQQAALDLELPAEMGHALVLEMVRGAALLACSERMHPPGCVSVLPLRGTTAAALRVLEEGPGHRF